jgi:hypothetical protein
MVPKPPLCRIIPQEFHNSPSPPLTFKRGDIPTQKPEESKKIEKDFMDIYFSKKKTRRKINVPIEEFLEI